MISDLLHHNFIGMKQEPMRAAVKGAGLTLPQLSDACCDEAHGEADQVVFGALFSELLRLLEDKPECVAEINSFRRATWATRRRTLIQLTKVLAHSQIQVNFGQLVTGSKKTHSCRGVNGSMEWLGWVLKHAPVQLGRWTDWGSCWRLFSCTGGCCPHSWRLQSGSHRPSPWQSPSTERRQSETQHQRHWQTLTAADSGPSPVQAQDDTQERAPCSDGEKLRTPKGKLH